MELNEILSKVDHTLLAQTATWAEIKAICDDGMKYHTASVCIPASYVKQAKDYVGSKLAICTVIGFPNGYDTTKAKCLEALDAVQNGADAVYLGWGAFNARRGAKNFSDEEFAAALAYCHERGVRVFLTLNTLVTDRELPQALETAVQAGRLGVDAVLVQDWGLFGLLRRTLPDLPLHASTQMSLFTSGGAREIAVQAMAAGVRLGHIVSATGSGGTAAGLLLGAGLFLPGVKVTGIAVDSGPFDKIVPRLAGEAAALLECPFQPEENAFQMVEHMGPGYALPNPEDTPYIEELARTEGILLDPVYTGKAFAGMMQLLRQGAFDGQDDLLFVHTGGTAALFAIDLPR